MAASASILRPTRPRTRSATAVAVACVALFTDMLVFGLAIPVLPLLPATVAAGPAATGALFAGNAAAMILVTPVAGGDGRPIGATRAGITSTGEAAAA